MFDYANKAVLVPGRFTFRLQAFATRLIPRAMMVRIGEQASRKIMLAGHASGTRSPMNTRLTN